MQRFLLFIREIGTEDITDAYPDEPSARKALADYVQSRTRQDGAPHHSRDDVVIADYFRDDRALYAITRAGAGC